MRYANLPRIALHFREDGDPDGRPLVFLNSLGTDFRIWDEVVGLLPGGFRIIRFDQRGHGLSDCPPGPYSMGALVTDAEHLLDHLEVRGATIVGLSIGGMISQGLAVKRPDMVRAMVLSNTAVKIGTTEMWAERAAAVRAEGVAALSDAILERWFTSTFRKGSEIGLWRNMLERQPPEGYAASAEAIAGTDLMTPTSGLNLPTLVIAGSEDGATPPDLVRETAELIQGARLHLIRAAGHIPCVEAPEAYAAILIEFLEETAHV